MKEVKIPEERVAVLIGTNGETKEDIEQMTECEIEIKDNVTKVSGDPLDEMEAADIVKAIGRGFNPDKALKIVERDVMLHVIHITDYADTPNSQERLKGRVIGRDGETRRHIEKEANVDLSVYGKTIGIIGNAQNIQIVDEVIKQLLNGASHSTAYNYLEKNQSKIKR